MTFVLLLLLLVVLSKQLIDSSSKTDETANCHHRRPRSLDRLCVVRE